MSSKSVNFLRSAISTQCISVSSEKNMRKKILFGDRMHAHEMVTRQNRPSLGICSTTFDQFARYLSYPNFPLFHDLRTRPYLLNHSSVRSDIYSAAKRKEIESLVGMAIFLGRN
jgi:hypothetical protein